MTPRWNLITEGGEIVQFETVAELFDFVLARMEREAEDEEE